MFGDYADLEGASYDCNDLNLSSDKIMQRFSGKFEKGTICVAYITFEPLEDGDTVIYNDMIIIRENTIDGVHAEKHIQSFLDEFAFKNYVYGHYDDTNIKVKLFLSYSPCEKCVSDMLSFIGDSDNDNKLLFDIVISFSRLYYDGEGLKRYPAILDPKCGIRLKAFDITDRYELTRLVSVWEQKRLRKVLFEQQIRELDDEHREKFDQLRRIFTKT